MIVGFAGKAQSGKTTAAKALEPCGFRILSYGSGIKEECVQFLERHDVDFGPENFYGALVKKEMPLQMNAYAAVKELPEFLDFVHMCSKHKLSTLYIKFSARQLMQWWGTEFRRRQDPHYWVKRCMTRAAHLELEGHNIAIDDVRFPNEANAVKMAGGGLFYIKRDPQPDTMFADHESEVALDEHTSMMTTIHNDVSLPAFIMRVQKTVLQPEADVCGIDGSPI